MTDAIMDDLTAIFVSKMIASNRAVERAKEIHKDVCQRSPIPWRVAKAALKEYGRSEEDRKQEQDAHRSVLTAIGVQVEMFELHTLRRNDAIEKARGEGRFAAVMGEGEDCYEYTPGSPEYNAWLEGHRDFVAALKDYDERINAPRTVVDADTGEVL